MFISLKLFKDVYAKWRDCLIKISREYLVCTMLPNRFLQFFMNILCILNWFYCIENVFITCNSTKFHASIFIMFIIINLLLCMFEKNICIDTLFLIENMYVHIVCIFFLVYHFGLFLLICIHLFSQNCQS